MKSTNIAKRVGVDRLRIWQHLFSLLCLPILLGAMLDSTNAQGLSSHSITIVVPYSPGTGPDVMARNIGEELQKRWNQAIVIDNKAGASGNIGTQIAARAAPDGHTLLMTSNNFTTTVSLFNNVPYDPIKSFEPIIGLGVGSLALCVHPSVPVNNVKEFIAYTRLHQGELNYGSPGIGGPHHLAMELLKQVTHIDIRHVPYRGSAGATQDIVGGHVTGGFLSLSIAAPLARSNSLRILGVASKERVPTAPELPTLAEQGVEGVEAELWFGLLAPAGTPREIIVRYNEAINELVREPHVIELAARQGIEVRGGTPQQLAEFLARDIKTWRKVVKEAGIKAE
ncbi:MAG TPA: tripartite tricarboxylate transporter substrate binding protein [Xanthobacteraceae bacterium]|nr:tripartite tricarboxylate transporter substrate binding protein [Xanthobacteraceae bacterium]